MTFLSKAPADTYMADLMNTKSTQKVGTPQKRVAKSSASWSLFVIGALDRKKYGFVCKGEILSGKVKRNWCCK